MEKKHKMASKDAAASSQASMTINNRLQQKMVRDIHIKRDLRRSQEAADLEDESSGFY